MTTGNPIKLADLISSIAGVNASRYGHPDINNVLFEDNEFKGRFRGYFSPAEANKLAARFKAAKLFDNPPLDIRIRMRDDVPVADISIEADKLNLENLERAAQIINQSSGFYPQTNLANINSPAVTIDLMDNPSQIIRYGLAEAFGLKTIPAYGRISTEVFGTISGGEFPKDILGSSLNAFIIHPDTDLRAELSERFGKNNLTFKPHGKNPNMLIVQHKDEAVPCSEIEEFLRDSLQYLAEDYVGTKFAQAAMAIERQA